MHGLVMQGNTIQIVVSNSELNLQLGELNVCYRHAPQIIYHIQNDLTILASQLSVEHDHNFE